MNPNESASCLYDRIGIGYTDKRRSDEHWFAAIREALGDSRSVVNIGAGTGSYEPPELRVLAVEPSMRMIEQRPAGSAPVVRASAEHLPLRDACTDAALAVMTVHHWTDWRRGLAEMRRVARRQVVLAADTGKLAQFWLADEYVPELAAFERTRRSAVQIAAELDAHTVVPLPLAADFTDGLYPAFWRRPEAFLDPQVRASSSALAQIDPGAVARGVERLRADLESGVWHARHADLLTASEYDAGFRLVVAG